MQLTASISGQYPFVDNAYPATFEYRLKVAGQLIAIGKIPLNNGYIAFTGLVGHSVSQNTGSVCRYTVHRNYGDGGRQPARTSSTIQCGLGKWLAGACRTGCKQHQRGQRRNDTRNRLCPSMIVRNPHHFSACIALLGPWGQDPNDFERSKTARTICLTHTLHRKMSARSQTGRRYCMNGDLSATLSYNIRPL